MNVLANLGGVRPLIPTTLTPLERATPVLSRVHFRERRSVNARFGWTIDTFRSASSSRRAQASATSPPRRQGLFRTIMIQTKALRSLGEITAIVVIGSSMACSLIGVIAQATGGSA
jgi:hypothetical protein